MGATAGNAISPLAAPVPIRYPLPTPRGGLAERLRSGLQIREDRFDSGTRLHLPRFDIRVGGRATRRQLVDGYAKKG
jgi:hypothetical protein